MSFEISTAFAQQYVGNCELVVQQVASRAREKVMIRDMTGYEKAYVEYVGKAQTQQITVDEGDTIWGSMPHKRRVITTQPYGGAEVISDENKARTLVDFTNPYIQSLRAGLNRDLDNLIFTAMRGTAYSGKTGTTSVALPSAQKVAVGGTGLSVEKLISAMEILNSADVPDESEGGANYQKWCAIGPKQVSNLLRETEIGSADFNLVKPLVDGKVVRFMGFNFVMSNQLYATGGTRYCLAWVKAGMYLGINYDISATVDRLPTKWNAIGIIMKMMAGAARVQEELVVEIACAE